MILLKEAEQNWCFGKRYRRWNSELSRAEDNEKENNENTLYELSSPYNFKVNDSENEEFSSDFNDKKVS